MDLTNLNRDKKNRRKTAPDLSTMIYGKVPPQAKDLEEAVLGAVMLEKAAFDAVVEYSNLKLSMLKATKEYTGPCNRWLIKASPLIYSL